MSEYGYTDVDTGTIRNGVEIINTEIDKLFRIASDIGGVTINHLTPYWQGAARDKFDSQFNEFSKMLQGFLTTYKELNEQLRIANSSYEVEDNKLRDVVDGMQREFISI